MSQPQETHPRTVADEIAELKAADIPQERFDAFAPHDNPIHYESNLSRVTKQTATRIGHAIWEGTGGRGAHSASSRETRDNEREAVGLPPKYRKIHVSGSSSPAQTIKVHKA